MEIRHNWTLSEVNQLLEKPFMDLLFEAQLVHRQYQQHNYVQVSTLLSIKTGACPEDCKYCPQSARYQTDVEKERLMDVERVLDAAQKAKNAGSTRFCMGAAWKNPKERDMPLLKAMIAGVKDMGLETCMTLGMLTPDQANQLADAGLDYYNHNLDTSPEYYGNIITTRTYQDRLDTLSHVRDAGMKICSGGIIGMGESANDRAGLLMELANLPTHPESVPINMLVKVKGTPLEDAEDVEPFDFIRLIAIARIMMPQSAVRLSAGRENMNEQMQALCFMAGANSIFYGCKLLTTPNPAEDADMKLFRKLGINSQPIVQKPDEIQESELLDRVAERVAARPTQDDLFYDASVKTRIAHALAERAQQGLTRTLQTLSRDSGTRIQQNHHLCCNFSSNDYLGMATDPSLIAHWQQALAILGCGSGASPLVTGFHQPHQNLESILCEWLGYERAILFNAGFSANQAVLFSLLEAGDCLIQDKLNHASLIEAGQLCRAEMKRFRHNDMRHLSQLLSAQQPHFVVTEGVFSMDGDCAPLAVIADLVADQGWLMVDDAHGVGVLGPSGQGSCAAAGIKPDILVVTFGKAFGLSGAAVMCGAEVGDYLTQFARHHVYSTAMPPAQADTLCHAVKMIQSQDWRREKLTSLIATYQELASDLPGFVNSQTPIQPFLIGQAEQAMLVSEHMKQAGVWVSAIRPPTVPQGTARLRMTITAAHTTEEVTQLVNTLRCALEIIHA